jgi:hypothetical protein
VEAYCPTDAQASAGAAIDSISFNEKSFAETGLEV